MPKRENFEVLEVKTGSRGKWWVGARQGLCAGTATGLVLDTDSSADSLTKAWGLPESLAEETQCFMPFFG